MINPFYFEKCSWPHNLNIKQINKTINTKGNHKILTETNDFNPFILIIRVIIIKMNFKISINKYIF